MNRQALHTLLAHTLGLVPEPTENAVSRTYFHQRVEWHPHQSTRVFRVLYGPDGEPSRIQLCASSDNNNSVLIQAPFHAQVLIDLANQEVALIESRVPSQVCSR